ncbi:MAG TPA: hypothetical protein VLL95_02625, partial [Phnomibacter sp.]|nr:hypothetical protein [Phnomibacter sp.]
MRKSFTYLLLSLASLLGMNPLFAAVFTVTTKADAGPGSFRDALTKAANNGASEKDSILFNLPGATDADRTIILLSKLPEMTSNLVIDGTSQPGPGFGTGFAKVRLEVANVPQPFDPYNIPSILEASKQEDISIFGLVFFYSNWTIFSTNEKCGGVKFSECKRIKIGAAGKGNIFKGVTYAISCLSQFATANYDPKAGGLIVQGNMVGYTENGDFPYLSGAYFNYTEYFLATSYFGNILIGGDKVEDGNVVNASNISIWGWSSIGTDDIRIANNSFCVSSRRNPGIDSSQNSITIRIRDQNQGVIVENNIINGF